MDDGAGLVAVVATAISAVDTRREQTKAAALRRFWTKAALERAGQCDDDVFAFNLGTVALPDLPAEALLLANVQLVRMA